MGKKQTNAQREMQLVAEWLTTLPAGYASKTHIKVGSDPLFYNGERLRPEISRALGVWSDWADARVVTPSEVWIVEGKLVATGSAYGQLLDYMDQYRLGDDYKQWVPRAIVGIVVAQATRQRLSSLFAPQGIRTITFAPSFTLEQSLAKLFTGAQILVPGVELPLVTDTGKTYLVKDYNPITTPNPVP